MDERVREPLFPVKAVEWSENIENPEILTEPCDLQIGLSETHLLRVGGRGYVILDFGKEINGCIRVLTQTTEDGAGCTVRVRTGESLTETCAEIGQKNAGNHHSVRDFTAELPIYSDREFDETGFRFVRIDFLEEKRVLVKAILAVYVRRDLLPAGGFVCDDGRVNRIFEVASRTLRLNMQKYIWDGIKRDRLVWIGDMHPETLGIVCLFGRDELVERSLSYTTAHTPADAWINGIPTYTAWWIVILHDYFEQNENFAYLAEQKEFLLAAVARLDGEVDEKGAVKMNDGYLFDWPSHFTPDEKVGVHAVFTLAAAAAERLLLRLGCDPAPAERLLEKLARGNGALEVKERKQCEAFLVYAGVKPAADSYAFLTEGGARGFSTFMSYYILSAIAEVSPEKAVELMKEYYGAMLDLGATSFWEDFDLDWAKGSAPLDRFPREGEKDIHGDFGNFCYVGHRHSLCHGWSCGPVPFLIKKIGGIEILEAGCKKVRVSPRAAGFRWYEIKYPTPFGTIGISYRDGKFEVSAPDGVVLERG